MISRGKVRGLLVASALVTASALGCLSPATSAAAPLGEITGTVFSASTGATLGGIQVCLYDAGSEAELTCAETGYGGGNYEIDGVAAGSYKLSYSQSYEGGGAEYETRYSGEKTSLAEATPVVVGPSQIAMHVDARLPRSPSAPSQTGISGTITGPPTGMPADGAGVCAIGVGSGATPESCVTTEFWGHYAILGLEPGTYTVSYSLRPGDGFLQHYSTGPPSQPAPVQVVGNQVTTGIDAELSTVTELHGAVYSAATGVPLLGILVCVTTASSEAPIKCVRSGEYGYYQLFAPSGTYKMSFSAPIEGEDDGYETQYSGEKPTFAEASSFEVDAPWIPPEVNAHLLGPGPPPTGSGVDPGLTGLVGTTAAQSQGAATRRRRAAVRRHRRARRLRHSRHHRAG